MHYSTDCPDTTYQPSLATKVPRRQGWLKKEKPPGRGRAASTAMLAKAYSRRPKQWAKLLNEQ
jgi:hypothetical protein